MEVPTIPELFRGKSVLLTGGTGFMGKVLLEKLLHSCPDIERLYIITRSKRGLSADQRLAQISALPIFERVKRERPGVLESKVEVVEGDMLKAGLGLDQETRERLAAEVSFVFHAAATIRFNEPLAQAVALNTAATKELLTLAQTMSKLQAFVHVSTAYSNCDRKEVREEVYPPHYDWRTVLKIVERTEPVHLNILSEKFIGELPNTYTFTKSLAEQIVWEQRDRLPVVIFRPSIVISSWKEPVPGWVDNLNGPMGIMVGYGKGVVRTMLTDKDAVPDYMAVDIATRALIVAAWRRVLHNDSSKTAHIYNASSASKSISTKEMITLAIQGAEKYPVLESLWSYSTHTTNSKWWYTVNVWFKHVLPAIFVDMALRLLGRKPMLVEVHGKIYRAVMSLSYFTTQAWVFHNDNFLSLGRELLPQDKEAFDMDFQEIDPAEYFEIAMIGGKKYLLGETEDMLPAARLKLARFKMVDRGLKYFFYFLFFWIMFVVCQVPQRCFHKITGTLLSLFYDSSEI